MWIFDPFLKIFSFKDTILYSTSLNINVIAFTEIRLESHLSYLYDIPGYNLFTNSRNIHGGGVALYISSDYDLLVQNHLTISDSFIESLGVEASIVSKKSLFLCIYRPPRGNFGEFITAMNDILLFMRKIIRVFMFLKISIWIY